MERKEIVGAVLWSMEADSTAGLRDRRDSPFSAFTPSDWDSFLRALNGFGLSPLFYARHRSRAGEWEIPPSVLERLRASYLANASRNMRIYHDLKGILEAFHAVGIPVLVLKGAHITELVHHDIGARAMADLDVLIRETDADRAHRALTGLGYRRDELHGERPAEGHHFHYSEKEKFALVELHWRLFSAFYPFRFDHEAIWRNARAASLSGSPAAVLSPEDLLLHIAAHASIHMFAFGLRDLCDTAQIIRSAGDSLDWDRILSQARDWEVANCAYLTLLLASRLLRAGIPDRVLEDLRPADFDEAYFDAAKKAILAPPRTSSDEPPPHPNLVLLFGRKGAGAKAAILARKFFPSRQAIAALYPVSARSPRLPYFYLKWMATLFRRNARSARSLLNGRRRGRVSEAAPGAEIAPLMSWLLRP